MGGEAHSVRWRRGFFFFNFILWGKNNAFYSRARAPAGESARERRGCTLQMWARLLLLWPGLSRFDTAANEALRFAFSPSSLFYFNFFVRRGRRLQLRFCSLQTPTEASIHTLAHNTGHCVVGRVGGGSVGLSVRRGGSLRRGSGVQHTRTHAGETVDSFSLRKATTTGL